MKKTPMIVFALIAMFCLSAVAYAMTNFANIRVTLVNQYPYQAEPGDIIDVRWKIENLGGEPVKNLEFTVDEDKIFTVYTGEVLRNIGSLEGRQMDDEGIIVHYKIKVSEDAVPGESELRVRYRSGGGAWIEIDPFEIQVKSVDAILYVKDVVVSPERVGPSEMVSVRLTLENLADLKLKDIRASLTLVQVLSSATSVSVSERPFSPVGSTSEKIIEELSPKKSAVVEYKLISDTNIASQVYRIPLAITYKDEHGNNYSTTSIITVVAGVEPELMVLTESEDMLKAGVKATVPLKFVNYGDGDIKFLRISVGSSSAYEIINGGEQYIGNIDSDDYETADVELFINPTEAKEFEMPVSVSYQDGNFEEYKTEQALKVKLYTDADLIRLGLKSVNGHSNSTLFIVAAVILVLCYFGYKRFRKKKEE